MSGGRRIRSWALSKGRSQAAGGVEVLLLCRRPQQLGPGGSASLAAQESPLRPKQPLKS